MGWFRGRRKRRAAGSAGELPGRAAGPAAATTAMTAADARQASAAASPNARPAFEQEPATASRAAVLDPVPWRRLEDGAWERLLAPLQYDESVSALLDYCERGAHWDDDTARRLIERTTHAKPVLDRLLGRELPAQAQSAEFINGLIKALALLPAEDAVPLLVRLGSQQCGLTATSMPTARAAIRALATVPGELVPPALHRLAAEARLATLRRAAYAELKRKLSTLSDAPEWTVSTFGLDTTSRVRVPVGPGHVAVVRVETGGRVGVRYFERTGPEAAEGRPLSGKPTAATVEQDALNSVSELASELRTAVNAARTRLESAQRERREVPVEDWLEHYIVHPVTGRLSQTLLWEVRTKDGEEWRMGLPRQVEGRWGLITADTERIVPGDGDVLRVLALVRLPAAQARAWTRLLAKAKVKPVLKQIKSP
jgi:hypothetical protein